MINQAFIDIETRGFLKKAVVANDIIVVNEILSNKNTDLGDTGTDLLFVALENGYIEIFKLLFNDSRVDNGKYADLSIKYACIKKHIDIIMMFLKDDNIVISPLVLKDLLLFSSTNGYVDIIRILINGKGIDPSCDNNILIRKASENGHTKVVELLLQDSRVDPMANDNDPICGAAYHGHFEVVKLLLQDHRVNPVGADYSDIHNSNSLIASIEENRDLSKEKRRDRIEITKLLMKDNLIDPSVDDNYPIFCASSNGDLEVVKILLEDTRVIIGNTCIKHVFGNNCCEVLKYLLEQSKIKITSDIKKKIEDKIVNGKYTYYINKYIDILYIVVWKEIKDVMNIKVVNSGAANLIIPEDIKQHIIYTYIASEFPTICRLKS